MLVTLKMKYCIKFVNCAFKINITLKFIARMQINVTILKRYLYTCNTEGFYTKGDV